MQSEPGYFSRRAEEEKQAAETAATGAARDAHLEMAARYQKLAEGGASEDDDEAAGGDDPMTASAPQQPA